MVAAMDMVECARKEFGSDLPSVIIASGPSFSTFVAGLFLTRGNDRKLVLEYRDEWTLCPFDLASKTHADRTWEMRCLKRADLIILTTESQRHHLEASFPGLVDGKCAMIPNGWEPELSASGQLSEAGAPPEDQVRWLTFAGMLGEHSDPTRFLQSLAAVLERRSDLLARVRVRFVGKKRPIMKERLRSFPIEGIVHDMDQVPPVTSARMMRESSAVLLFHSKHFERYIPGKLYEYAASGTPILLFDDSGESQRIVEKLRFGHCLASDDPVGLEAALDSLLTPMPLSRMGVDESVRTEQARWCHAHTRRSLAGKFFQLIQSRTGRQLSSITGAEQGADSGRR